MMNITKYKKICARASRVPIYKLINIIINFPRTATEIAKLRGIIMNTQELDNHCHINDSYILMQ